MEVMVTGATGYLGKHMVRGALRRGWRVTATLQEMGRAEEVRAAVGEGDLTFATVDLLAQDGWAEAMEGIDVVLHTASPVPTGAVADPDGVLRPAIEGTSRVLQRAMDAGVRHVVMTSSIAAVFGGKPKKGAYTADDWTDPDARGVRVYARSKTLAELMAWELVEGSKTHLTTILPGFIYGAPLDASYGSSVLLAERLMKGKDPMLPRLSFPSVGVRDVVEAHLLAVERELYGGRIIASTRTLWMQELADLVRDIPGAGPARVTAPNALIRLLARFDPMLRDVATGLGVFYEMETTPFQTMLGNPPRDPRAAFREMAEYVAANPRKRRK